MSSEERLAKLKAMRRVQVHDTLAPQSDVSTSGPRITPTPTNSGPDEKLGSGAAFAKPQKKSYRLHVILPTDLYARLEAASKQYGLKVSEVIRQSLEQTLPKA